MARALLNAPGMRTWLAFAVLALTGATGCDLYFNGGDDAPCAYDDRGGVAIAYAEYRDPSTGTCIGGGGYYPCDDKCGPCPAAEIAPPDMGMCVSECTGLSEGTCQATSGCYASYWDDPAADGKRVFEGCWETAPSGPVQGICEGLDAYECSRHDDCSLIYSGFDGATKFITCASEPGGGYCLDDSECGAGSHCDTSNGCYMKPCPDGICADADATVCYGLCVVDSPSCFGSDCAPGYHCEEQCYGNGGNGTMTWCETVCVPDDNLSCTAVLCAPGYTCIESCEYVNGDLQCGPQCVPDNTGDPGSCYGQVACDALPPACPAGTTPGRTNACWTGYCIPNNDCGPNDPGSCYGDTLCDALPPACPSGTTAGITNGCWSGYCIPTYECAAQSCESLTSQTACTSRDDCVAVYTGTNCTCYPNGCTCSSLTFDRCETL